MNSTCTGEEAVFQAALSLESDRRPAFLAEACAGNDALRARVEALLAAHDQTGGVLDRLQHGSANQTLTLALPAGEQAGDKIGPYKLLQQIGEGGCGVVWMAEQVQPVRRRVALKVIKLGMDTRQVVARFEAERQALALMDHPNIAKVLDAGATETGRPFFVMELVRGVRITEYCDRHRLPTDERLRLFTQVCRAVQHAHQKGIIHRDLKPSNILVADHDGVAVPKVIDFGIAKATTDQRLTDKTLFTAFEQFIGTPAYMSPEQANLSGLDIDTRTDVYSLGVLLYELLTGQTPFEPGQLLQAGLEGMRRAIRELEPARPSNRLSTLAAADLTTTANHRQTDAPRLIHLVRGDLDWIVMKCLEKDRSRRYETVNGLAMDIGRHLASEPVAARPPSLGYRAGKAIRKHKGPAIAAGAILAALCAGLVVSWVSLAREQKARSLALQEGVKARIAAAKSADTARFLAEMLAGIDPEHARGRDVSVLTEILQRAARRVDSELRDQPEVEANLRLAIGDVYLALGRPAAAQPHLERALTLAQRALESEHRDTISAMLSLASTHRSLGRFPAAQQMNERAVEIARRTYGEQDRLTIRTEGNLAVDYLERGDFRKAEDLLRQLLRRSQAALGAEDATTLQVRATLANALIDSDQAAEAEALQRESLAIKRRVLGDDHPDTLKEINNLASSLLNLGRVAEAETLYREAWDTEKRVHGEDQPATMIPMHNVATVYLNHQSRFAEAETLLRRELEVYQRHFGLENPQTLSAMADLGVALSLQNKLAEAETVTRSALEISGWLHGPEHPVTLRLQNNLAAIFSKTPASQAAAEDLNRQVLAQRNRVLGPAHRDSLQTAGNLLVSLRNRQEWTQAEALCRETLESALKVLGSNNPATLAWQNHLAGVLHEGNRSAEAEVLLRQTLQIARSTEPPCLTEALRSLEKLGAIAQAGGRWDELLECYRQRCAWQTNDSILPLARAALLAWFGKSVEHAQSAETLFAQADTSAEPFVAERAAKAFCLLPSTNRAGLEKALALARRAADAGRNSSVLPYYQLALGMAQYRNGSWDDAERALAQALASGTGNSHVTSPALCFRAMTRFRQGRTEEARRVLADSHLSFPDAAGADQLLREGASHDDVIAWLAWREAKALVEPGAASSTARK